MMSWCSTFPLYRILSCLIPLAWQNGHIDVTVNSRVGKNYRIAVHQFSFMNRYVSFCFMSLLIRSSVYSRSRLLVSFIQRHSSKVFTKILREDMKEEGQE